MGKKYEKKFPKGLALRACVTYNASFFTRCVAQSGSALAWGASGRRFKSYHTDQFQTASKSRPFFCSFTPLSASHLPTSFPPALNRKNDWGAPDPPLPFFLGGGSFQPGFEQDDRSAWLRWPSAVFRRDDWVDRGRRPRAPASPGRASAIQVPQDAAAKASSLKKPPCPTARLAPGRPCPIRPRLHKRPRIDCFVAAKKGARFIPRNAETSLGLVQGKTPLKPAPRLRLPVFFPPPERNKKTAGNRGLNNFLERQTNPARTQGLIAIFKTPSRWCANKS